MATKKKFCMVTGGAGYVGSHFCKALAEDGEFTPVVFDLIDRGHEELVKWGPLVRGDIRDRDALDRAFAEYRPECVFHFAGLTYVGESVSQPERYYDVNLVGAKTMIDAALASGCGRIVFSSTAAVYGEPDAALISEDAPKQPINPYGRSKLAVEWALADCSAAHGLNYAALRYFNASGADPDGQTGERHDPETHLIPLVIQAALGQRDCIKIFGTDYPTPDGTAVRDYIHVADLADAHIRAMRYIASHDADLTLNLGTGQGASVREVVDTVRRISGRDFKVVETERRAGDPPTLVADSARAKELLGWQPRSSSLGNIVATALRWHESELSRHSLI